MKCDFILRRIWTSFFNHLLQSCILHLKSDNGPIEVFLSESAVGDSQAKEQASRQSPLKASTSAANTSRPKLRPTRTKASKALLQTNKPVLKAPKKVGFMITIERFFTVLHLRNVMVSDFISDCVEFWKIWCHKWRKGICYVEVIAWHMLLVQFIDWKIYFPFVCHSWHIQSSVLSWCTGPWILITSVYKKHWLKYVQP